MLHGKNLDAFDNYTIHCSPLSDFMKARRKFESVEQEYRSHADEEDMGAENSYEGKSYSGRAGKDCNSGELAKARNYAEAIYNIWNDPRGISKPKLIKLIRGNIPNADVGGLTKNELVDWARQLFNIPNGEIKQEDGSRTRFEHNFSKYDLDENRYLDKKELVWAKCKNYFI